MFTVAWRFLHSFNKKAKYGIITTRGEKRMENKNLLFMRKAPLIEIKISDTKIGIEVFFSVSDCDFICDLHKKGLDDRTSFAMLVFKMYKRTKQENDSLAEQDFINASDDNLLLVMNKILEQDDDMRSSFEEHSTENLYERFYEVNIARRENFEKEISKAFNKINIDNKFERLNKVYDEAMMPSKHYQTLETIESMIQSNQNIWARFNQQKFNEPICTAIAMQNAIPRFETFFSNTNISSFPCLASVLANIPTVNLSRMTLPIEEMLEGLKTVSEIAAREAQNSILQLSDAAKQFASTVDFSLLLYRNKWSDERDTLLKYGWFYTNELPYNIILGIHKHRDELSCDDVDKIILGYFRQNRCAALKSMVKGWVELPFFKCRQRVFHEVIVNHSRKYFNSSVVLLTIYIEGIITDFVRINLKTPRYKVLRAIEDIKEIMNEANLSHDWKECLDNIIDQIIEAFQEDFNYADPDAAPNYSRHKIAHGHVYEEASEADSLKKFLYLNELYNLFVQLNRSTDNVEEKVKDIS